MRSRRSRLTKPTLAEPALLSITTLRDRPVSIAVKIVCASRSVVVQMVEVMAPRDLFAGMPTQIALLRALTTVRLGTEKTVAEHTELIRAPLGWLSRYQFNDGPKA
jgi:hypothetical protein